MSKLYFTAVNGEADKRASPFYKDEAVAATHCDRQNAKAKGNEWKTRYSIVDVNEDDPIVEPKEIRDSLPSAAA